MQSNNCVVSTSCARANFTQKGQRPSKLRPQLIQMKAMAKGGEEPTARVSVDDDTTLPVPLACFFSCARRQKESASPAGRIHHTLYVVIRKKSFSVIFRGRRSYCKRIAHHFFLGPGTSCPSLHIAVRDHWRNGHLARQQLGSQHAQLASGR